MTEYTQQSTTSDLSVEDLRRATVVSTDGQKIGQVGEVYLDDTTGAPAWVTVKTGFFGSSETFVPLESATRSGDDLRVPFSKAQVKDAPRTDADGHLDPAEESRLYSYYGMTEGGTDSARTDTTEGRRTDAAYANADYVPGDGQNAHSRTAQTGGRRDRTGEAGVVGTDVSGPTTDDAMTLSEERLTVGTERRESGRARLRKYIVTERQTEQVAVSHEELTLQREPITEANRGAAMSGAELSEEEHEVVLHEERPVVSKTVEAVERVSLGKETVHDTQTVSADVRKEQVELDRNVDPSLEGRDKY